MPATTFAALELELGSIARLQTSVAAQKTLIDEWINEAIVELCDRDDWYFLLSREAVQTVPDKVAGTISINAGATVATGTGTAFDGSEVGYFVRFTSFGGGDWYKVTAVNVQAQTLTIELPFTGTTNLVNGNYTLRKIFYSLSANAEKIISARQAISPRPIRVVHHTHFDPAFPNMGGDATGYGELMLPYGTDSNGNLVVCIWPPNANIYNIELRTKKYPTLDDLSWMPEKFRRCIRHYSLGLALEYIRTDPNDKRPESKFAMFEGLLVRLKAQPVQRQIVLQSADINNQERVGVPVLPQEYGDRR